MFQNASIDDDDDWADFGGFEVKHPLSKSQIIYAIDQNKTIIPVNSLALGVSLTPAG